MIFQEQLAESMQKHSKRIAVEYGDRQLSYADLREMAVKVTGTLQAAGIQEQAVIGVELSDRIDFIAAIIGIMNARCVFVPLDSTLPPARLDMLLKDLDLRYLIAPGNQPDRAGDDRLVFHAKDIFTGEAVSAGTPAFDPEDAVYIYYTSGSTGIPKGIVGKNSSLLQFLQWEIDAFAVNEDSRFSQLISPYFDAFLRDVFVPLLTGGTVCIPPAADDLLVPDKLVAWLDTEAVTFIHCVPSVFRLFNAPSLTGDHFRHLTHILLSGERIIPGELRQWYHTFGSRIQLINFYGATESTMIRCYHRLSESDSSAARIPIGSPIADTEIIIADTRLNPCSALTTGEVLIASAFLTKGYLNNPELTHEKFITLHKGQPGAIAAFRTGDSGRKLANGTIDLLGREDRQVKLRGIRVELDEIENAISRFDAVDKVWLTKITDDRGEDSLLAFITLHGEKNATDVDRLTAYLEQQLPAYMIPAEMVVVDEFPVLGNGKINQKELLKKKPVKQVVIPPANDTETRLLKIWQDILGDKPISTTESFHKLGGNSISIMRLIGRIYTVFGVRLSLSKLFDHPTIQQQAANILSRQKDDLFVIKNAPDREAYVLSSAQERMYYNYELNKDRNSYNIPLAWEIQGDFDKEKVEKTLAALIERHESLRTAFVLVEGKVMQVIRKDVSYILEEMTAGPADVTDVIRKFIRPFDLAVAPLIRMGVIDVRGGKNVLLLDMHHIICDGLSQSILLRDFAALYHGNTLPELPIRYRDFAEWEANFKQTEEYIRDREFWLSSFERDVPLLELPVSQPVEDDLSDKGGNIKFSISKERIQALTAHLQKEEITTFSALFAAYFVFLARLTGQDDIVVGAATSGRTQQEVENVVGMFVKTLPVRYQLDSEQSFTAFLKNIHRYLVEANSRQQYDLTNIIIELNKLHATPVRRLFDVVFVFQNFYKTNRHQQGDEVRALEFENRNAKYPVTLFAAEEDDLFTFRLEYSSAFFTAGDAETLASQFTETVEKISDNLHEPVTTIIGAAPLLPEEDIVFNL